MSTPTPRWLVITLISLAMAFHSTAETSAAKLLDKTIHHPGYWSQMCLRPKPLPFDVPIPLYSLAAPRMSSLSPENVVALQAHRGEIVSEIIVRLHKLDLSKPPSRATNYSTDNDSNEDPNYLSGLMLDIILKLNAVETLPELLRLEADLNQRLEKAAKNERAPLPDLDLDSPQMWQEMNRDHPPTKRQQHVFVTRIYQCELLAVMAALLRHEKFQPLLDSAVEKRYAELTKRDQNAEASTGWGHSDDYFIPYTPELRKEIRKFVQDFLKQPPNKSGQAPTPSVK